MELNKLHFRDCKEVLSELPDKSITAFIQDPPFEATANKWDKGFIKQLPELWELWKAKGKDNQDRKACCRRGKQFYCIVPKYIHVRIRFDTVKVMSDLN